ncbi:structure-specific endonuclease subunit slx1-like [Gigantopelta aegis]|uniref:structure-specific endonuclease subunit slx1-like n=1 Tax=Gigantopelta aegis TaxID=1735272 RepID=UPI001B88E680|nr:structure-specific endonuclease subunit slx1-like [Gigantopelta aegis]XP_041348697.1 structure-specific endonuclease subunit slx1-like [Gigantopelta aegis]XP_041348698.1 structure-specific endonuclease subunit slx1-like [Gigantopelta aegis]
MVHEIEDFYGVYLLYNLNPKYKGRTYIGYTVDPNRRIKQHNTGAQAGGAWRTDGKGPWEMVLIIHGFPNDISALRFEWAWQHPDKSRRLRHLSKKSKKESQFEFRFRIVSQMLRTGPWNRLPLNIRWLKQEFKLDFPPEASPPIHMPIVYGPVKSKRIGKKGKGREEKAPNESESDEMDLCRITLKHSLCEICYSRFKPEDSKVSCFHPNCSMVSHMLCLSRRFITEKDEVIPIDGPCPKCKQILLWGDVIRHKNGCYQNLNESTGQSDVTPGTDSDNWD